MASIINSTNTGVGGLIYQAGTNNELEIQTGDVTAIAIDAAQNVDVTGNLTFDNGKEVLAIGKAVAMLVVFGS